jgi:SAM-dependent methyltransferase
MDAEKHEEWLRREPGRTVLSIEKEILYRVWFPLSPQKVLEIGCGAGHFLEWFSQQGHQATGIDPSPSMLRLARKRLPKRVHLHHGYAEDLPFENNEFDTVAIITSLEFVENPAEALREATRVARNHLLLGVLNKYSLITLQHYFQCLWKVSIYRRAHFFSVFELWRLIRRVLCGHAPLRWRTCLSLPLWSLSCFQSIEKSPYFQWHPFGHFIAMRVDLHYNLQTLQDPLLNTVPRHVGSTAEIHFESDPQEGRTFLDSLSNSRLQR